MQYRPAYLLAELRINISYSLFTLLSCSSSLQKLEPHRPKQCPQSPTVVLTYWKQIPEIGLNRLMGPNLLFFHPIFDNLQ